MSSSSASNRSKDDAGSITLIPGDLLAITYGCVVQQLAEDYGDPDVVSDILHTMGKNMGLRMSDEVLAKAKAPICSTYPEYVQACANIGFEKLLNTPARVVKTTSDTTFTIEFDRNPLAEDVELPESLAQLWYSNVICGVIEGIFQTLRLETVCKFLKDTLHKDKCNVIQIEIKGETKESMSSAFET